MLKITARKCKKFVMILKNYFKFHLLINVIHHHSNSASDNRLTTNVKLIERTSTNTKVDRILIARPFANSPITLVLEVNVTKGMTANGSCSVMITFRKSFNTVISSMLLKYATQNVGIIAIVRVKTTRRQRTHLKFRKPSITNCPAYVPVIVADCPDAKIPMAQMYSAYMPNAQPKKIPPLYKSPSTMSSLYPNVELASPYR